MNKSLMKGLVVISSACKGKEKNVSDPGKSLTRTLPRLSPRSRAHRYTILQANNSQVSKIHPGRALQLTSFLHVSKPRHVGNVSNHQRKAKKNPSWIKRRRRVGL